MTRKITKSFDIRQEVIERLFTVYDYRRIKQEENISKNEFIEEIYLFYLSKKRDLEAKAIKWTEPEK